MPDPYLYAMMHGRKSAVPPAKIKDSFELEIEKNINEYIESLHIDEEYAQNLYVTPEMKKAQIRTEIETSMKVSELENYIAEAFKILIVEGRDYLENEPFLEMEEQIKSIGAKLDADQSSTETFQSSLKISNSVMTSILRIAVAKYEATDYPKSLSILILLSVLNSRNPDYWYRLGVVAQKCENYELALQALNNALDLRPDLFEAYLFASECYLFMNQTESAKIYFEKGKELVLANLYEEDAHEEMWGELISELEMVLYKK